MALRFILALVLLSVAAPAFAQSASQGAARTAAVRDGSRLRLGPFYFNPSLSIDNIGVDDNVFLDSETGEPQSDFVVSMTPRLVTSLPMASRALMTLSVAPRVDYYREFANARSVAHSFAGRGEVFLGRLAVFGDAGLQVGRMRPNDEIDTRPGRRQTSFAVGADFTPLPKLSFETGVYRSVERYDDDEVFLGTRLSETLDHETEGVRLSVRQRLTPKTSISLEGDLSRSGFAHSPVRDASSYRIAPGVSFSLTALIAGSAHVGFRRFVPESPDLPGSSGLFASVDLSYTLREATRFGVQWTRDVTYSYERDQPYYLLDALGGTVRRQVAGRVDAIFGYRQSVSRYEVLTSVEQDAPRRDITRTYSADLGMRINRRSRVGLRYVQSGRRSNQKTFRDYGRRQIGLSYMYGM